MDLAGEWHVVVVGEASQDVEWPRPIVPSFGRCCVCMPVHNGVLHMAELHSAAEQGDAVAAEWWAVVSVNASTQRTIPLKSALRLAGAAGQDAFVAQVMMCAARELDAIVSDVVFAQQEHIGIDVRDIDRSNYERIMQELLVAYKDKAAAALKASFERWHMLSVTMDDSNIRGCEIKNTALVTQGNIGVWAPVQVVLVQGDRPP